MRTVGQLAFIITILPFFTAFANQDGYRHWEIPVNQNAIGSLTADQFGNTWFASDTDGDQLCDAVFYYDQNTSTTNLFAENLEYISSIVKAPNETDFYISHNGSYNAQPQSAISRLRDLNNDADCLDPGEVEEFLPIGTLGGIKALTLDNNGRFYAITFDENDISYFPYIYRISDLNGDGDAADFDESKLYYSGGVTPMTSIVADPFYPGKVYYCSISRMLYCLTDRNNSGSIDSSEVSLCARNIGELNRMVMDHTGTIYATDNSYANVELRVFRIEPDGPDPDEASDNWETVLTLPAYKGVFTGLAISSTEQPFIPYHKDSSVLYATTSGTGAMYPHEIQAWNGEVDHDPFIDRVVSVTYGSNAGFGQDGFPEIVLGWPQGRGFASGSLDTLTLGDSGEIVVEFTDNEIIDGPGVDFIIFENAFVVAGTPDSRFIETAIVSVSEDGVNYYLFPYDYNAAATEIKLPQNYHGFAGVNYVFSSPSNGVLPWNTELAGGDAFDLQVVGLASARFVKIQDTGRDTVDDDGDLVDDPGNYSLCSDNCGFDLDAVVAVNNRWITPVATYTPTPTPTLAETTTPLPTQTPTPELVGNFIGGYWNTLLSEARGGTLRLLMYPILSTLPPDLGIFIHDLYTGLTLKDDGLHGDLEAGDGIYGVAIPFRRGELTGLRGHYVVEVKNPLDESRIFWPYLVVE